MQLKSQQLLSAKRLLKEAFNLVADVQSIFHNAGDSDTTERMKSIGEDILNEIERVDGLSSAKS